VSGRIDDYPYPTSPSVTAVMKGNRRVDTKPEVALRSHLHSKGLRFRKDHPIDVGRRKVRPDIVFTKKRVAVFVDGCFWHLCPEHGRVPGGKNSAYWETKLRRNSDRDRLDTQRLEDRGWQVVRVWEHEPPEAAAELVVRRLNP